MYAFKPLLSQDVILFPFEVNKKFEYSGSNITSSGIDVFLGKNTISTGSYTGFINSQSSYLVYKSIEKLYYANYISSSNGDSIKQKILIPGYDVSGDVYIGDNKNSYINRFDTTLHFPKYFPTSSGSEILVISIPKNIYGEYIKPNTFNIYIQNSLFNDDGEGNIVNQENEVIGNIFYNHGLIVFYNRTRLISVDFNLAEIYDGGLFNTSSNPNSIIIETPSIIESRPNWPYITNTLYLSSSVSSISILEPDNNNINSTNFTSWLSGSLFPLINNNLLDGWRAELILSSSNVFSNGGSRIYSSSIRFTNTTQLTSSVGFDSYFTLDTFGALINFSSSLYYGYGNELSSSYNTNFTCSFSSSFILYENQYRCEINKNEFNFSLNPSLNSSSYIYNFATSSDFKPYVTTIGLYNEYKELMAVAKLSQPLPLSNHMNTNIIIRIDR